MFERIQILDFSILNWIQNDLRTSLGDQIFPLITWLGDSGMIWILCSIIMLLFRRTRLLGVVSLLALLAGNLLGEQVIKPLVGRERPFHSIPNFQLLISPPHGFSFPSGHSWSSFCGATMVFVANKKFGIAAFVLAALIAFSRLYLYVHFPSDVLVGSLCGIATACLFVWLMRKTNLEHRFLSSMCHKAK